MKREKEVYLQLKYQLIMHKLKQVFCALIFFFLCLGSRAQPLPDSVKTLYISASSDYAKHECLHIYLENIRNDSNFNTIAAELQRYFRNKNDQSSFDYVELTKIGVKSKTGNYANALDKSLEYVKIFHDRQDDYGEVLANYRVTQALYYADELEESNVYNLSKLPLALKLKNNRELALCYNAIASVCAVLNKADSGILYANKGLYYAKKVDAEMVASISGKIGRASCRERV